jgi:Ig-like domain CHU_C associated/Secretion system C-terminal sorting domain
MKNSTKVAVSIFAIAVASICVSEYSSPAIGNNPNPPTGRSGSPGDGGAVCTSCHGSSTTANTTSITSNIPSTGYISGQSYTVTINAAASSTLGFGFCLSPQWSSTPRTVIGTMATLDNTTRVSSSWLTNTQKKSGTSVSWQFKWTAPGSANQTAANLSGNKSNGNFYSSILCANNDGNNNSSDHPQQTNTPITENTLASITIASGTTTICSGGSASFTSTFTNEGTSPTYQWQINGSNVNNATSSTFTTTALANNDNVTCVLTSSKTGATYTSGSFATSNQISVTVNPSPTIDGTTPASRCDAGTLALGATASSGTINWYSAPSGGSSLGTGTTFTTPTLTVTTTYYVDATGGGCTTGSRTSVTASITGPPTITNTTPASRCDAGTVSLGATASTGTINWYDVPTGGTSLGTGTTFTTPTLTITTTYYVDADDGTCTSTSRTSVDATIGGGGPSITSTSPGSRCDAGTVNLGAGSSAGTIDWYDVPTGGVSLGTGTTFTTPSLTVTTTYYVDATNAGCTTASRSSVSATVNPLPTAAISGDATICSGANSPISIALTGTSPWSFTYVSAAGPNPVSGITASTYTASVAAGTYTISSVSDGNTCNGTFGGTATIIEDTPISVTNFTYTCNGGTYTVDFDINGGDPTTYTVTGDAGTLTGSHFTSNAITSGVSYSFTPNDQYNCNSTAQTGTPNCGCAASANISGNGTICNGSAATLTITLAGAQPWDFTYAIDGSPQTAVTGWANSTYTFTTSTTGAYSMVSVNDANCSGGSISGGVTVSQTVPSATLSGNVSVCADGSAANLTIAFTGSAPWTFAYSDGTNTTNSTSSNSNTVLPVIPLQTPATYTYSMVSVSDASCAGTPSGGATITVNALPTVGITIPSATVCAGTSVTLTGTGASTYAWTGGPNTNTYTSTVMVPTSYTVTGTDGNACVSQAVQLISIFPISSIVVTASPSASVCAGTSVTLTASGSGNYVWVGGASQSVPFTPSSTKTYTVSGTDVNNCASIATQAVTVNQLPVVTVSASPSTSVCSGNSVTLSASGAATYTWSDAGGSLGSGQSISPSPTANTTYTVIGTDINSCSAVAMQSVTVSTCVNPVPPTPTITRPSPGTLLVSSSAVGNQWYLDGVLIPGAVYQTLPLSQTTKSGNYTVIVTVNGVPSAMSDPYNIDNTNTGVNEVSFGADFIVYPNPNDGNFNVVLNISERATYKLEVKNMLGQSAYQEVLTNFNGGYSKQINVADFGQGVFMISLTGPNNETIKKIVVY